MTATLGSGDSDVFSFDANTGRTTKYQFNVNGQSDTGTLTWNANGSLNQLAITDALSSADSQTCTYAHDDLSRIASVNCGSSTWQQNFGYDAFGNITKTVPTGGTGNSFQPTYNSATNHFSSIPGTTVSYDAAGNVLADGSHTYSWDAYGKATTIDSVSLTYDAFGRMIEQNRSGAYTEIVYSPAGGKLALMMGQTLQKGLIPLPSGGQAVYSSSGLLYYGHSDHLGSMRLGSTPSRALEFDLAHAPFGEIYASSGTLHPAFTGQRQDTVAGLFDFPAREYSTQGRWPSPDPAGLAAVDSTNPQSWNRYAYVLNNPLALVDPLGMNDCAPGEHTCANNNGGIPDEGGIDLFGANNFWDGTPYIGLGGGNNGVNRPISIPIFMPTGLYLQGSFLLDGVPVLIPDTFWVSNAINHDTWNIPIVTQGVTLYYPLSGPGGGRGGGGGGGGRNTGANPGMCYAKPTEKCDAEYYACVQKATAGAVGTGSGLIAAGGAAFELGKVGCVGAGEFEAGCLGIMEIFSDSWLYFSLGTGRASYDSRVADCDNQRAKCYAQTCQ